MTYEEILERLPTTMTIICACGRELELQVENGQYQEFYIGACDCGLKWELVNLNALFDIDTPPVLGTKLVEE